MSGHTLESLRQERTRLNALPEFPPLERARGIEVLQINLGKKCNQRCRHCHVDAGPDRTEMMSSETIQACLKAIEAERIPTVDITGGAPELHPEFRRLIRECRRLGAEVIVRCNLTVLVSGSAQQDLPEFYAQQRVQLFASLPHFQANWTDRQRGPHVFEKSIEALKRLNTVGFGQPGSGLVLNLVTNPIGAFLPGSQKELEREFQVALKRDHGVVFDQLFALANLPVSRFLDSLVQANKLEEYLELLVSAYNPVAAENVMCRTLVSVGWDGTLYDCDFNQMLELPLASARAPRIEEFSVADLGSRTIQVGMHCYGCTAGSGSSCGGATA